MSVRIKLLGRHAVGDAEYAIVDDDLHAELARFKWKAKPNGSANNVYAVRVVRDTDGRWRDVRMHRVVLGYDGPLDIDHINHVGTDNRRENLRVVTRRENCINQREEEKSFECSACGKRWTAKERIGIHGRRYCSMVCETLAQRVRGAGLSASRVEIRPCAVCGQTHVFRGGRGSFCSEGCKKRAKWARQRDGGCLPQSSTAERQRDRRRERSAKVLP